MNQIFISRNFKSSSNKDKWKIVGKISLYLFGVGFLSVVGIFLYFAKDLPSANSVDAKLIAQSTKIYDRSGEHLLYDVHGEEKRTVIPFAQIPDNVKYATIALEDQEFYSHFGVNPKAILRSAFKDIIKGGAAQGGSTITQQFIKKSLLSDEKTFTRKIKEVILAIELEQKYSKDEILAMYLNQIPYGSSAYGIEAAAQTFFSKSAKDLNLAEAVLLASLPNAPTYYSPFGSHRDALVGRKNSALRKMADLGYITQEQADEAKGVDIFAAITPKQDNIQAPHFVMYVKEYLEQKYGEQAVEQGGLKVYTTLDWDKQKAAEKAVVEGAEKNKAQNASNAALVAMDPKTGQILAMVGSKNYFDKSIDGQVNVALADRQPGSSFKPYVYLTAFTKGYTPETLLYDVATNFSTDEGKDYKPQNYDGKFKGPLQMKNALAMSLNIPAVKTLYLAGVKDSIQLAKGLGIKGLNQPERYGLSLVLGGGEVTLLDHVNAYGGLATGGIHYDKTAILKIQDKDGAVLEEFKQSAGQRIVEEKYVAMLDYIMSTNELRAPVFGDNNPFKFSDRQVAAKTGTTNEFRDGWAMGYTPSIAVGVWAGNNDNSSMKVGADGIYVAAPIWRSFMNFALGNSAAEQFPKYEKEDAGKPILNGEQDIKEDVKVCEMDAKDYKGDYCLANDSCPDGTSDKKTFGEVHSILFYVKKDDPRGDYPKDPSDDSQYKNWEKGVQDWFKKDKKKNKDLDPIPTLECKEEYFKPKEEPEPEPEPEQEPVVVTPTCSDGIQNGNETGKDCGGGCTACLII
ncbi:MAG: glycosyl transferase family 51, peptidoglycan glycosyltransferase [Parcubacteria group bacterium GW2011_GWC1_36_108]|nr:MAG: glycosyl transferase family 51, peptidoglycan glycosyltransferase [Parcubacteria group bacterium GW2011_GWC1_36_108]